MGKSKDMVEGEGEDHLFRGHGFDVVDGVALECVGVALRVTQTRSIVRLKTAVEASICGRWREWGSVRG